MSDEPSDVDRLDLATLERWQADHPFSPAALTALRALSRLWRERADREDSEREYDSAYVHKDVADELDHVLAVLASPMHPS